VRFEATSYRLSTESIGAQAGGPAATSALRMIGT
jgi:hypothetical protein